VSGALTLVKPVAGLWRKIDMLTALNLRSGRAMQVAPKQAELRDIARHLLTLAETLREQQRYGPICSTARGNWPVKES